MMGRGLGLFAIGVIFGGGTGFLVAAGQGITLDGHDHSDAAHHGAAVDHAAHDMPFDVPAAGAPEVTATLTPDPMSGYNLYVTTHNFAFTPEAASLAHVAGQGHAHVYVNDEKLGRLYANWLHLETLPKGDITLEVTLNTNDHRIFTVNGTPVSARISTTIDCMARHP